MNPKKQNLAEWRICTGTEVVPKAQRDKDKKDVKRSKDNPASNEDVKITVDPYSQYAQVSDAQISKKKS